MNLTAVKNHILVAIFSSLPVFAFAQQEITVKGVIYKQDVSERISQVIVTDTRSQVMMMSDELGGFNITATKGDTLLFTKKDCTPQKEVVTGPADMMVYMHAIVQLGEVVVKDKSSQQEINDVITDYRSKGLYFDGKPSAWSYLNSPLTSLYESFGRDAKNERHFMAFAKDENEAVTVDKRYTRELVKRVTGLPDDDVIKFMQQYTPAYEDMKQWNDYELISHIKKFLVYYKKNKEGIKLQKLY